MPYDLTKDNIPRLLARFAWPMVLTNLLQTLFSLTDVLLAGRLLGADAMGAVTVGGQSILFLTTFSLGLTAGGQILIAQLKGADAKQGQGQAAGALFTLSLLVGTIMALTGFFFAAPILQFLQTPETALASAKQYMKLTSLGLLFTFAYHAVAGVLRGLGDAKGPLIFAAVAAVLHLGLGVLLAGVWELGILGLALATVIAQAAAALLGAVTLYMRRRTFVFDFRFKSFLPPLSKIRQVLQIGIPFGLQMGLLQLANLFITRLVTPHGVAATAALGAGSRVTNMLVIPMLAIGNAASTITGQNLGANQPSRADQAVRWALVYTLGFAVLTTALTLLFPARFIDLFTDNPEVVQIGVKYLTILAWCYIGHALHSGFNSAILAAGLTLYSLLSAAAEGLLGRMGLTWLFSGFWGLPGIFTAQAIAPYLSAALSFFFWKRNRWRQKDIVDKILHE
ncbi:MAG: MATE family efflux transporter [Oscillospiraceae bacterium]|nr:MATE family efflux transporter [Oscillospiraceae bacterium]